MTTDRTDTIDPNQNVKPTQLSPEELDEELKKWTLEKLLLGNHTSFLGTLKSELASITGGSASLQSQNALLNKLMTMIGQVTDNKDGTIHFGQMQGLDEILKKANKMGIDLPEMKGDMSRERGIQLMENVKNIMNANQLELNMKVNKMNSIQMSLSEAYQFARSAFQTLHQIKKKMIDAMSGR